MCIRDSWYLCRQYTAAEALEMGLVNKVVPFEDLEAECVSWAQEMLQFSPTALRFMKASFNAATDEMCIRDSALSAQRHGIPAKTVSLGR